jgi:non-specific serine/threonine protein kinase
MLETIREFAVEQLEASDEGEDLRRRHAAFFRDMALHAEPDLIDAWHPSLGRLETELDNLRAALDWLQAHDAPAFVELAGALGEFWMQRDHFLEGERRVDLAIAAAPPDSPARAKVLAAAGSIASATGDPARGRGYAEEALAIYRGVDDSRGIATAAWNLGYALGELEEWAKANELLRESVSRFAELGDLHRLLWATRTLAWTYAGLENVEEARRIHTENLERARSIGSRDAEATTLGALAMLELDAGDHRRAMRMLVEHTGIAQELGDRLGLAVSASRMAAAFMVAGEADLAIRLMACADVVQQELGTNIPWVAKSNEEARALARVHLSDDDIAAAQAAGSHMTIEEATELSLARAAELVDPEG